jgi:hypothetical protein
MRFSASFVLAAMMLAAAALPATAAPAARAKANGQTGVWEIVQGEFAGRQTCMAIGSADDSTFLMLKLDTSHMADHVIAIILGNTSWSIKEGDELGELEFHAGDTTAGAEPVAADHGFFFYMSLEPAQVWFDKTKASGFWIERNGKEIARYRGGNLAETFNKIRACGEKLIKADPFAEKVEASPPSSRTASPSITDPAATPPKPINLGLWIKAIEKDYFAGPPGDSSAAASAHEMRNSMPASARFRISVSAAGEMTNCDVIGTYGLPDWAWSFCTIGLRHSLKFAPAQTATGKPVAGEYTNTAEVRFED